jgi:hypothetical protein
VDNPRTEAPREAEMAAIFSMDGKSHGAADAGPHWRWRAGRKSC